MTNKKNKALQAVAVLLLTATIAFAGTFAWQSFTQSKINVFTDLQQPNVNLHDDFAEGPNKDVYVENSGNTPSYLRVRLTEYLQTELRGSLVEGHLYEESKARDWAPHNGMKTTTESGEPSGCTLLPPNATAPQWKGESFHDYYTWQMGGSEFNPTGEIYYLPATKEQQGGYEADGTTVREPQVVSNPLTASSPTGDAHLVYIDQVKEMIAADNGTAGDADYPDVPVDDAPALATAKEAKAMETLGIKKTLTAKVMTMARWKTGNGPEPTDPAYIPPYAMGDYWVVDTDGWCYWANPLAGGEATGLLLDAVIRTKKTYDSNAEYAINVWLQAVDAADTGRFETPDAGGMTDDGKKLIGLATGKIVTDTDGSEYLNNGNGTYTPAAPDGTPSPDAKPFVPLGEDDVNVPPDNRMEIGQRVTLDALIWDGEDYVNWEIESAKTAPWYNITKTNVTNSNLDGDKTIYEILGTDTGLDGVVYLKLSGLVPKEGTVNEYIPGGDTLSATAVTRTVTRSAGGYTQAHPGSGPLAFIWPGDDGKLGDSDDSRLDPSTVMSTRYFAHMGSGVYVETESADSTVSKDTPVKYFFAGKAVAATAITSPDYLIDQKITALFPLQLAQDDKFNVTEAVADGQTKVTNYTPAANGKYTLTPPMLGADGKLYIYLGAKNLGYLAVGSDEYLGNDGDVRIWAGLDDTIGTDDDLGITPYVFSEPFLADKTLADMKPGKKFTASGQEWLVLDDKNFDTGNRLIIATGRPSAPVVIAFSGGPGTNNSNIYPGSGLQMWIGDLDIAISEPTLRNCVQPVNIPVDTVTTCSTSGAKVTFALSAKDVERYPSLMTSANGNWAIANSWFTRTASSGTTYVYAINTSGQKVSYLYTDKLPMRPAAVVKFSH